MSDPASLIAELQSYFDADAAKDAAAAAQIADLQAQVAALSAPKQFVHITITEGTPPKCKLEFFNGQTVEKDFPSEGDLSFTVDVTVS